MRQRRTLFPLLTAAGVVLLSALGGEAVARWLGARPYESEATTLPWATPHPQLGWVNREGVHASHDPGAVPMTFWRGSQRATRPSPERGSHSREVALLGGSWFAGFGVRDDQTFAWRAGQWLPDVAFQNYGTGGYGTYQSWRMLRILAANDVVEPDLVVYGLTSFHGMRNVLTWQWANGLRDLSGQRLAAPHVRIDGDRMIEQPPTTIPGWPLESRSALSRALHDAWFRWHLRDRDAQIVKAMLQLVIEMKKTSEQLGARFLVMTLLPAKDPMLFDGPFDELGIDHIDCTYPGDPTLPHLRVGSTGHPNEIVHEHWARCLVDWMQESALAGGAVRGRG